MKPGAVMVDVAIDQGGCFETSHPTTHHEPTFEVDGITHYCVANMPGAVPITSTQALTNATLPYAIAIADHGLKGAIERIPGLRPGVNVAAGKVTHPAVAEGVGMDFVPFEQALGIAWRADAGVWVEAGQDEGSSGVVAALASRCARPAAGAEEEVHRCDGRRATIVGTAGDTSSTGRLAAT